MNRSFAVLEKLSLNVKLTIGFGLMLLLIAGVGLNALRSQEAINTSTQVIYDKDLLGITRLKNAQISLAKIGHTLHQAILTPNMADREKALAMLDAAKSDLKQSLDEAKPHIFRDQGRRNLIKFEELYDQYQRSVNQATALLEKSRNDASEFVSTPEFQNTSIAADEALNQVARIKENGAKKSAWEAQQVSEHSLLLTILLLMGGTGGCVILSLFISLSIKRPSEKLQWTVRQLAEGQLDLKIPHTDYANEIGELARSIEVLQPVRCRWKSNVG